MDAPIVHTACPNCGGMRLESFYRVGNIPSHSCLLMDTPEQARSFPTADLELAFCEDCGFITNVIYDESLQAYSTSYEETQHFSAHFSQFARDLAQQWIDHFDVRKKHVLEIGCGKGEFLELICELGDNRGTGIDPGCIPERLSEATRQRIEFLREYYGPKHADLKADVILCRHTLEHIPQTLAFLQQVRETITPDTLLLFELPDTKRVLRECAFWDIYYEHCSYFTAGSLARLFRQCGLDVVDLQRVYGDQYLILAAKPSNGSSNRLPIELDLEQSRSEVDDFKSRIDQSLNHWKQTVDDLSANGRVIAWGAGSKCVAFATTLGISGQLDYVVDINPHKQGKYLPGTAHAVVGPEQVRERHPVGVIVMNPVYREEIRRELARYGAQPKLICLE